MALNLAARQDPPEESGGEVFLQELDDYDLPAFLDVVRGFGDSRLGYVVTPNVDHMILYREDARFRAAYERASYVLLDSRFAALVLRITRGLRLHVCAGSDLTAAVLEQVVRPSDHLLLIGGSPAQAGMLRERYGLRDLQHYNPPMGFIDNPAAVEECLQVIEAASPFRFCLFAVGTPRQEYLALKLAERGRARGLVLCVGASINFLTGGERRAPPWIRNMGMEWLFRLVRNPRRLAYRYLVRGPRFFAYVGHMQFRLRGRG